MAAEHELFYETADAKLVAVDSPPLARISSSAV